MRLCILLGGDLGNFVYDKEETGRILEDATNIAGKAGLKDLVVLLLLSSCS
jgi:copper homeostasis protein CutC